MPNTLSISQVVRDTGLTARALRHYGALGLVDPLRTAAGRRLYSAGDLARIHQIVALKNAGFSLADIKLIFDHSPVDLATMLAAQRDMLRRRVTEASSALALVEAAISRLESDQALDLETLCSLIREEDRPMKTEAEAWRTVLARQIQRMPMTTQIGRQDYRAKWKSLIARIEKAQPLDPASDVTLGLVREWCKLLQPYVSRATPEMWKMFLGPDMWQTYLHTVFQSDLGDFGISKQTSDVLLEAAENAWAKGKFVAPLSGA